MKKSYCESYYNYLVELPNGNMLLYNTRFGSISKINKECADSIVKTLKNPNENLDNEYFSVLYKNGYIIDETVNELEDIKEVYHKYVNDDRIINMTLLPAETCNFKCPYCFIYSHRNIMMEEWVYDGALNFIRKRIEENTIKDKRTHLNLGWFGGEPTLCKDKILDFMRKLNELKSDKFTIKANIITNGYMLNYSNFKELLEVGIDSFQVTFDGDKEFHDKLRILKNGAPTFDIIMNNIKDIKYNINSSDEFSFNIRINFLRDSYSSVKTLIDKLVNIFNNDERFNIYCRPVYNFETDRNDINQVANNICTMEEGIAKQNDLAFYIMSKRTGGDITRIFDPLPTPTYSWCEEERKNSFIVGADGNLFVCDSFIGDESLSIGKITQNGDLILNEKSAKWKGSVFDMEGMDECIKCKRLPLCIGGCRRCRISGETKPCFWTEESIHSALIHYAQLRNII